MLQPSANQTALRPTRNIFIYDIKIVMTEVTKLNDRMVEGSESIH